MPKMCEEYPVYVCPGHCAAGCYIQGMGLEPLVDLYRDAKVAPLSEKEKRKMLEGDWPSVPPVDDSKRGPRPIDRQTRQFLIGILRDPNSTLVHVLGAALAALNASGIDRSTAETVRREIERVCQGAKK